MTQVVDVVTDVAEQVVVPIMGRPEGTSGRPRWPRHGAAVNEDGGQSVQTVPVGGRVPSTR